MLFIDRKRFAFSLMTLALVAPAFVLLTAGRTNAQWKKLYTNTYYSGEKVLMTSSPRGSKVDVSGSGFFTDFTDNVRIEKVVPELQLSDTQSGGRLWRLMSGSSAAGFFNIYDHNAGAYRLTIDTSGNVGIGTTTPPYRLSVTDSTIGGAVYAETGRTTGSNYGVQGGATGSGATLNVGGYFFARHGTSNRAIFIPPGYPDASSNNYSIYSQSEAQSYFAGNVGIGTTSPSSLVDIVGGEFRFSSQTASARTMGILYTTSGGPVTLSSSYSGAGSYQPLTLNLWCGKAQN